MNHRETVDVAIIGAGPAGISTALHLVKADSAWANRIIVLDKAVHPREKLCGGGVTQLGERVLANLGLSFEPSHLPVSEIRILYHHHVFAIRDEPVFRVVRRAEFDHWLVQCAQNRGIIVRQGEAVKNVRLREGSVEVVTDRAIIQAKTVVAADGSCSLVRKTLQKSDSRIRKARTLEVLTPEHSAHQAEFQQGIATYDFTPMVNGLQGYSWNFPCVVGGQMCMSRGVFDSRIYPGRPRMKLKSTLQQELTRTGHAPEEYRLKSFPIRLFQHDGVFARPHIIYAGDAAGVDPLFGEGISFALAYGEVAASEIVDAFAQHHFTFSQYKKHLLEHPILRHLQARTKIAKFVYKLPQFPWLSDRVWARTPFIFRMVATYKPHYIPIRTPQMNTFSRQ